MDTNLETAGTILFLLILGGFLLTLLRDLIDQHKKGH